MLQVKTLYTDEWEQIPAEEIERLGLEIREWLPKSDSNVISDRYVNILFDAEDLVFETELFVGNDSWRQVPSESQIGIGNPHYAIDTDTELERYIYDQLSDSMWYDDNYSNAPKKEELLIQAVRYTDDKTKKTVTCYPWNYSWQ